VGREREIETWVEFRNTPLFSLDTVLNVKARATVVLSWEARAIFGREPPRRAEQAHAASASAGSKGLPDLRTP
jgi:hypothetical protein